MMNRNKEFFDLVNEIQTNTPAGLETTVQRAIGKPRNRSRAMRRLRAPAAALAALALSFTVLVNTSAAFARTMGEVPALRELAMLVAQDPSLRAAVENKYVQPIGQAVTHDGVTVNIGYVIADEQRLSVFFDVRGEDPDAEYGVDQVSLAAMDGTYIPSIMSWGYPETGMQEARFDLAGSDRMPSDVRIAIRLRPLPTTDQSEPVPPAPIEDDWLSDPEPAETLPGEWIFDLHLDPALIARGDVHSIDQWVQIAGQRLYLESLTIFPTQAKLRFETDPRNTAFILGLDAWIENDRGEVWAGRKNGVAGTSDADGIEKKEVWLESSYFTPSEGLKLHISRAALIDKDAVDVTVDYAAGTVSPLPDFVRLVSMTPVGDKLRLKFDVTCGEGAFFCPFYSVYHNAEGEELSISVTSFHPHDDGTGTCVFEIEEYHQPVTLRIASVPLQDIEPIEIEIR